MLHLEEFLLLAMDIRMIELFDYCEIDRRLSYWESGVCSNIRLLLFWFLFFAYLCGVLGEKIND